MVRTSDYSENRFLTPVDLQPLGYMPDKDSVAPDTVSMRLDESSTMASEAVTEQLTLPIYDHHSAPTEQIPVLPVTAEMPSLTPTVQFAIGREVVAHSVAGRGSFTLYRPYEPRDRSS